MSASREKKIRQEQTASGYVDPKVLREEERRKAEKKSRILYASIAVVFVLVAAFLLVWKSGVLQRNATAVTIDGEKYSAADVSFYAYNVYSNYYNYIASMYGDGSYISYFLTAEQLNQYAIEQLTQTVNLYKAAKEAKYELSEKDQADIDAVMKNLESVAEASGYSVDKFLQQRYDGTMTKSVFKRNLEMNTLATSYSAFKSDSFSYTQSDLDQYYADHTIDFQVVDFDFLYLSSAAPSTTDADGKTVEPTAEEKAAAKAEAEKKANDALERYRKGEKLSDIAEELGEEVASFEEVTGYAYDADHADLLDWLFKTAAADGDSIVNYVEDDGYYVLVFHSKYRNDYHTVDVRHILVRLDTAGLDKTSSTYESDLAVAKEGARVEAQDIYDQWKAGEATEASFAKLADEKSDDTAKGGAVYEKTYKGQMVTEFNDWCFEEGRKSGDTGMIFSEGSNGWHIIYFVGENVPYWQLQVETVLRSADYDSWYKALTEGQTVTQEKGMKYVISML